MRNNREHPLDLRDLGPRWGAGTFLMSIRPESRRCISAVHIRTLKHCLCPKFAKLRSDRGLLERPMISKWSDHRWLSWKADSIHSCSGESCAHSCLDSWWSAPCGPTNLECLLEGSHDLKGLVMSSSLQFIWLSSSSPLLFLAFILFIMTLY